eukprot:12478214-Ditylum_brightwellii.AAC.2
MTVIKGVVHNYLGMTIDYSEQDKVMFFMTDCINKMLIELPPKFGSEAATPAANHLFAVNTEAEKLEKACAQVAHNNIAKLIFLCQRARPDIQTSVAFLITQVHKLNEDDWKKLIRVMKYL